ncbi:MAG: ATP synthase subunit I [Anaerolineaceae bacterium]|nr:ATP synthase subunit I [Anaerolineaceae bacterium]
MNWFEWPLWILLGIGTALFFLWMQKWSVQQIAPDKPVASQILILGGMLIRWVLIALVLILALRFSPVAGLIVFASFMITRLVVLATWEKRWRLAGIQTNSKKD